jgi:hypothetical protein
MGRQPAIGIFRDLTASFLNKKTRKHLRSSASDLRFRMPPGYDFEHCLEFRVS